MSSHPIIYNYESLLCFKATCSQGSRLRATSRNPDEEGPVLASHLHIHAAFIQNLGRGRYASKAGFRDAAIYAEFLLEIF